MTAQRVIGLVLLALGVVLLLLGYNASQSITERAMETITGRFTETTTWYFIGGVASVVAGFGLLAIGRK